MKTVSVRNLRKTIRKCVDEAQRDSVVITRNGMPAAVLVGVEGQDWETVVLQASPSFWKMIQERRKGKSIPLEEMIKRLESKK